VNDNGLTETEGEGYFASVSDLMVGVLFVFLLMLTILALNFRDDSAQLDALKAEAARQTLAAKHLRAINLAMKERLAEAATALRHELRDREAARAGRWDQVLARSALGCSPAFGFRALRNRPQRSDRRDAPHFARTWARAWRCAAMLRGCRKASRLPGG
jgi:hypothetical protein